jgi:CBS domain-containing protein
MFEARFHDTLIERDGELEGIVSGNEITRAKPERRGEIRVGQVPFVQVSAFLDESVLETHRAMLKKRLDIVPVVEKRIPGKLSVF